MTIIVMQQETATAARAPRNVMRCALPFLLKHPLAVLARYARWRERRVTERALAAMPMDLRKDFGWPGPDRT